MAVGGGRRHPLQGGGIRLDAARGAAAAGLDRSAGPEARLRGQGSARSDPVAAPGHSDGVPLRPRGECGGDSALRVGGNAPRARLPLLAPVRSRRLVAEAILARTGSARTGCGQRGASGRRPVAAGMEQALALGSALADVAIGLGACTELVRTRETLDLALGGRGVPILVVPELNEIAFGSFEGGPLARTGPGRGRAARRALPRRRGEPGERCEAVLGGAGVAPPPARGDGARGRPCPAGALHHRCLGRGFPASRVEPVAHAVPATLGREAVATAAATLRGWAEAPRFADTPFGG